MIALINSQTREYVHSKGRVILFESIDQASQFANQFFTYVKMRMIAEDMGRLPEVLNWQSSIAAEEWNYTTATAKIINYSELQKERN